MRRKEKHAVEAHAIHDHKGGEEVTMGLFKGVTVAGGGKRLSVMRPVVPKSEKQLEVEHFKGGEWERRGANQRRLRIANRPSDALMITNSLPRRFTHLSFLHPHVLRQHKHR